MCEDRLKSLYDDIISAAAADFFNNRIKVWTSKGDYVEK